MRRERTGRWAQASPGEKVERGREGLKRRTSEGPQIRKKAKGWKTGEDGLETRWKIRAEDQERREGIKSMRWRRIDK